MFATRFEQAEAAKGDSSFSSWSHAKFSNRVVYEPCDGRDVMVPRYALPHKVRARPPRPFQHNGKLYDIMGVDFSGQLMLRDARAVHQDMRIEKLLGQTVLFRRKLWRVAHLDSEPRTGYSTIQLVAGDGQKAIPRLMDLKQIHFSGSNGEKFMLGEVRHGMMRMMSLFDHTFLLLRLLPGQRFEARLHGRELEGVYKISVDANHSLIACGINSYGDTLQVPISFADIASRYKSVYSADFGTAFDVDAFEYHLDQARSTATHICKRIRRAVIQDPLFGSLPEDVYLRLTNGAEALRVFEQFIRSRTVSSSPIYCRSVTLFNISVNPCGDAHGVLNALVEFRRQNPNAKIVIVASKLGPTEFQESPEFQDYLQMLAHNQIDIDYFSGTDHSFRQVVHGKGIVIDDHVLFSTASIMDTKPINKADFSVEIPFGAASTFRCYIEEAMLGEASFKRRAKLAAELARFGVVINDPVAKLPYISRIQDALIRGANRKLIVSVSELRDPQLTRILIRRAADGVDVKIQVREIDEESRRLLDEAILQYLDVHLEDSSIWEPRPHFNAIIADGCVAYVGTSYLWPTQRNFIHHGRSFENGVVLCGRAVDSVISQIEALRNLALGKDMRLSRSIR